MAESFFSRETGKLIVAGLTGGIASGKSTVARFLKDSGSLIIDADQISREVVAPGQPAWHDIKDRFGDGVFTANGTIDRAKLGDLVFKDARLRRELERIIHPRVGAEIDARMKRCAERSPQAVVIMDIPLLFETGRTTDLSEIIVVYTSEENQRKRLMERDGYTVEEAQARMASQMPIEEKAKRATIVIDNNGSLSETRRQTLAVYRKLKELAGKKKP